MTYDVVYTDLFTKATRIAEVLERATHPAGHLRPRIFRGKAHGLKSWIYGLKVRALAFVRRSRYRGFVLVGQGPTSVSEGFAMVPRKRRFTWLRVIGMVVMSMLGALTAWAIVGWPISDGGKPVQSRTATTQETDAIDDDPTSRPSTISKKQEQPKPSPQFVRHEQGFALGDFAVVLTHVRLGKTQIRNPLTGDEFESEKDRLEIGLVLKNLSDNRKIQFTSWAEDQGTFGRKPSLVDEHGNNYFSRAPSLPYREAYWGPVKQAFAETLYPGDAAYDLLVFQPPVTAAQELRLTLPSLTFMPRGAIRFSIPRSAIGWDRTADHGPADYETDAGPMEPPKPAAERPPEPEPPDPTELERKAEAKLRLADSLFDRGKRSDAQRWYSEIVRDYPDTTAAAVAQKKLGSLK